MLCATGRNASARRPGDVRRPSPAALRAPRWRRGLQQAYPCVWAALLGAVALALRGRAQPAPERTMDGGGVCPPDRTSPPPRGQGQLHLEKWKTSVQWTPRGVTKYYFGRVACRPTT
eukprot:gene10528-biopygen7770